MVLLEEEHPASITRILPLSGGVGIALGSDLNAAVELSDIVVGVPIPAGPATFGSFAGTRHLYAPVSRRACHFPTVSFAVDFVFGRARSRCSQRLRKHPDPIPYHPLAPDT